MIVSPRHLLGWILIAFSSREGLILENLAFRQQLLCPTSAEMGEFETLRSWVNESLCDITVMTFAGSDWPPRRFADHWLANLAWG